MQHAGSLVADHGIFLVAAFELLVVTCRFLVAACEILVPDQGTRFPGTRFEPGPPALGVWSPGTGPAGKSPSKGLEYLSMDAPV